MTNLPSQTFWNLFIYLQQKKKKNIVKKLFLITGTEICFPASLIENTNEDLGMQISDDLHIRATNWCRLWLSRNFLVLV